MDGDVAMETGQDNNEEIFRELLKTKTEFDSKLEKFFGTEFSGAVRKVIDMLVRKYLAASAKHATRYQGILAGYGIETDFATRLEKDGDIYRLTVEVKLADIDPGLMMKAYKAIRKHSGVRDLSIEHLDTQYMVAQARLARAVKEMVQDTESSEEENNMEGT